MTQIVREVHVPQAQMVENVVEVPEVHTEEVSKHVPSDIVVQEVIREVPTAATVKVQSQRSLSFLYTTALWSTATPTCSRSHRRARRAAGSAKHRRDGDGLRVNSVSIRGSGLTRVCVRGWVRRLPHAARFPTVAWQVS
ncbi:unnamed protein product [Prorocentrum cordatum]|uniref:Uncharacterized protein n=1 Tax=Prorocentrum cordatum TaxID=2364126 RepID=A0ABN9UUT6_9DINO|nr:unnamed protein product [Polarella glacialis]